MRFVVTLFLAALVGAWSGCSRAEGTVEKSGQDSKVLLEHLVAGHLTELNGKYKLRVTETVYEPGGHIGVHHHAGPGIRLVQSGELTYIQGEKTTVYKAGAYFFEPGDITHTAYNRTKAPTVVLNFELLPADWSGSSAMPVPEPKPVAEQQAR